MSDPDRPTLARVPRSQNEQAWEDLRADGGLPESHQSTTKLPGKMGLTAESRPDDMAYAAGWNECLDEAAAAYDTLAQQLESWKSVAEIQAKEKDALAQQLQQAQDELRIVCEGAARVDAELQQATAERDAALTTGETLARRLSDLADKFDVLLKSVDSGAVKD